MLLRTFKTPLLLADAWHVARGLFDSSPALTLSSIGLCLLQAALPALNLWAGKQLMDSLSLQVFSSTVWGHLLMYLLVLLATSVLQSLQVLVQTLLTQHAQHHFHGRILHKTALLPPEELENPEALAALRMALQEGAQRPMGFWTQGLGLLQHLFSALSIGAVVASLGMGTVPLLLLAALPAFLVGQHFATRQHCLGLQQLPVLRRQAYLASLLTHEGWAKEVRLFGFEAHLLHQWQLQFKSFVEALAALLGRQTLWTLLGTLVSVSLMGGCLMLLLKHLFHQQQPVSAFAVLLMGASQLQGQCSLLLLSFSGLRQHLLHVRQIRAFLERHTRDLDAGLVWHGPIEEVEFEGVGFQYSPQGPMVLQDLSFRLKRGEVLALVGENGAGKSTLIKLLGCTLQPTAGRILFNGKDIRAYSVRSLQRQIGVLFQDFGQYQLTVQENITMGRPCPLAADLQAALDWSGSSRLVQHLPAQHQQTLGKLFEGGVQPSGGQWQRLALARLHFRQAVLQVLDEPTSALDPQAELEVLQQLKAQAADRLTVWVSHRLANVVQASHILVLHRGRILEQGHHQQLLAARGSYARLFHLQAEAYLRGVAL